ncbi:MAG: hypothetical protein ACO2PN_08515 [Pyrobaculum sp.]|jgi:hypothetical protein
MKPLLLLLTAAMVFSALTAHVIESGEFLNVTLILDKAPEGLAGYTINVTGGDVVHVRFPPWARLKEWSGNVLKAVDLGDEVRQGSTNVVLAAVTLKARGVVEISARIDDDNGNPRYETITIQVRQTSSAATQHTEQVSAQTAPATYTVVVEKPYVHPATYVAIAVAVVLAVLALYIAARRR